MICKKCNSKIEVPAKFCVYCGAPLEEVESTTTITPVEPVVTQPIESGVVQQNNAVGQVVVQPIETSAASETTINTVEPVVIPSNEPSGAEPTINPVGSTLVQPVEVNVETKPVEVNVTESSNQSTGVEVANETVTNVGVSANDVEKTKKKKNNTWIIVVLVILVLGLGGYLVYDKVITKDVKEEVKEDSSKQKSKDFDLVEAKKIVDKYISNHWQRENMFEGSITEEDKIVLAINYTESTKINYNCEEAFPNINMPEGDDYFIIETDNFWGACVDNSAGDDHYYDLVHTYDEVNKTYKELFGNGQELPKKMVSLYTYRYAYSEKYNAYITLSCECGGAFPPRSYYDVIKAVEKDNTLEVFINYVNFEYDEERKNYHVRNRQDMGVTIETIMDITDEQRKQLYDKVIKELDEDEIKTYKFTFKKSDTGYYLESIVNEVY